MFNRKSIAILCLSEVLSLHAMPGGHGPSITTSSRGQEAIALKKQILQSAETRYYIRGRWMQSNVPLTCELGAYGRNTYADVTDCFYERTKFTPQDSGAKPEQSFCGIGNRVGEKHIVNNPMADYGVSRPDMLVALSADEYRILENSLVDGSEKNLNCIVVDSD